MHSILSPSSASVWVHCPGSVLLSAQCEDLSDKTKSDAGTAVHAGIMAAIYDHSGIPVLKPQYDSALNYTFDAEESECIDLMVDHVFKTVREYKIEMVHCEEQVNIH